MSAEDREYLGSLQNAGGAGWADPERHAADLAMLATPAAQAELRAEMEWEARVS